MCIMDNRVKTKTMFVLYVMYFTLPGFPSYFENDTCWNLLRGLILILHHMTMLRCWAMVSKQDRPSSHIFLLTGLRIYTGEYKAQGPTLCPTEGRALRGPRALYSPV